VLAVRMLRKRREFCASYASERGLQWQSGDSLPPVTPLLRRGDSQRADERFDGVLPGGEQGTLAFYTYEARSSSQGQVNELHHFTVALIEVPEVVPFAPQLFCQRRSGFRFLDGAEDVFRTNKRVELESERLDQRCEIFAAPACDENWLRQLFSPTFVDFLAEQAPEGFAFEVAAGVLCANVNRHRQSAPELDALCEAAASCAKRLREEAAE
jgi:hypothetical protein